MASVDDDIEFAPIASSASWLGNDAVSGSESEAEEEELRPSRLGLGAKFQAHSDVSSALNSYINSIIFYPKTLILV